MAPPGFAQALLWWLKLGCISFGGPAGQIALMHRELVEQRRWVSESRFLHALNYCMVLPGPEAQQLATYLGWLLHGVKGGIAAGLLFVLPSLLVLVGLSWAYMALGATASAALLVGVRPAVVAIVLVAAWRLGRKTLRRPLHAVLAAASVLGIALGLPFPLLIALAALLGWLWRNSLLAVPATAAGAHGDATAALHGDSTPAPPHTRPQPLRLLLIALCGLALGLAVAGGLLLVLGGDSIFVTMLRFFTQAALITFGGAYAVMPYVFQQAVQTYGWITAPQMLDGLALGETTPGPLIMVVAFIGFVGGWSQATGIEPLHAGLLGAAVATFFTFLPSFLFILLGAPFIEQSRGRLSLAAPLAAIGAVVIGAILHLGGTLAVQVLFPASGFDALAAVLTVTGLVVLLREWLGLVPWLALAAVGGYAASRLLS